MNNKTLCYLGYFSLYKTDCKIYNKEAMENKKPRH